MSILASMAARFSTSAMSPRCAAEHRRSLACWICRGVARDACEPIVPRVLLSRQCCSPTTIGSDRWPPITRTSSPCRPCSTRKHAVCRWRVLWDAGRGRGNRRGKGGVGGVRSCNRCAARILARIKLYQSAQRGQVIPSALQRLQCEALAEVGRTHRGPNCIACTDPRHRCGNSAQLEHTQEPVGTVRFWIVSGGLSLDDWLYIDVVSLEYSPSQGPPPLLSRPCDSGAGRLGSDRGTLAGRLRGKPP